MTEVVKLNGQQRGHFDGDGKSKGAEECQRASRSVAHLGRLLKEALNRMSEEERPTTLSMPTSLTTRMTLKQHGRSRGRSVPREVKMFSSSRDLTMIETQVRIPHNQRCNGKSQRSGDKVLMTRKDSSIDRHRRHNATIQIDEFLHSSASDHHSSGRALDDMSRQRRGSSYRPSHPDRDHAIYKQTPVNRSPRPMRNTIRHKHSSSRQHFRSSDGESTTNEESRRGNRDQLLNNNGGAKSFCYLTSDRKTSVRARGESLPRQRRDGFHSSTSDHQACRARGDSFLRQRRMDDGIEGRFHSSPRARQISCQDHGQRYPQASPSGRLKSRLAHAREAVRRRSKNEEKSNRHCPKFHPDIYDECYQGSPPRRPLRVLHIESQQEQSQKFSHSQDNADDHITVDSGVSKLTFESGSIDEFPGSNVICDNNDSFLIRC